jgi:O-antigen ligase
MALVALAAWSLFAFAGAYRWTVVPLMVTALAAAALARPRVGRGPHRHLDTFLILGLVAVCTQIAPLPPVVQRVLSPRSAAAHRALYLGLDADAFSTLSLDPGATGWSLGLALTMALVFWTARDQFERGGIRRVCRGLAWCGLVLAVTMFVQRRLSPHQVYGFWSPLTRTSNPTIFGPFVNRNDFAAWLLMTIPLITGYLLARMASSTGGRWTAAAIESAIDARLVVLTGAVVLMTAALVASLSRSGLLGLCAGLGTLAVLGRGRMGVAGTGAFGLATVTLLLLALQYTNMGALAFRLGDSLPADLQGRTTIWRETWPMARDFLGTGIGVGAFERGMLIYQQSDRLLFFNHAHNEYLQLLAEGGLLVALPAVAAALVGGRTAWRRLHRDESAAFWIRAGAIGSLVAIATQSVWDTGLRMPANGVLFAVVAAAALHGDRRAAPLHGVPPGSAAPG